MTSRTNLSKIENFSQNKKNHIIGDIESSRTINLSSLQTFHVDHFLIFHLKARKAKKLDALLRVTVKRNVRYYFHIDDFDNITTYFGLDL